MKRKVDYVAKFAVTGSNPGKTPEKLKGIKNDLKEFEKVLKEHKYEGIMSNETAREDLFFEWIIAFHWVYQDTGDIFNKGYAYRSHNGRDTTKPKILKIKTATRRLKKGIY